MTIQANVLFSHDRLGRIISVNEPGNSIAPRFFLGCTNNGNVTRYRYDLPNETISELKQLVSKHSNYIDLAKIVNILSREQKINNIWVGPAFMFSNHLTMPNRVIRITDSNKELLQCNFPKLLEQLEWRQPCFAIIDKGTAVSICCSARSTSSASEASVETLEDFQGKGYGSDVVTAWAIAVQKEQRIPLYSTSWDNFSSQALAKKLKLINYGTDVHIT
ncbi:hypothetical protein BAMA_06265 [Bacillus manliponensis]|uniref:Uncharacterized protein n=1 Tax=Bacillus manliponensis TaxID=574376 RepID=A0A073JV24_9BACI|nr:GNAT family N-acetyltransferase [Bacillus manliponensis]KEK18165.1 hypothetical protein BAMA_06265 [Bacillus manliponensis]